MRTLRVLSLALSLCLLGCPTAPVDPGTDAATADAGSIDDTGSANDAGSSACEATPPTCVDQ